MKKRIVKKRFKEMFVLRNTSGKKFGLALENEGTISYRSLQRNLSSETMKESVLIRCAELLDCHPSYLQGESNRVWENDFVSFPIYRNHPPLVDSEGIFIPSFEEYLADKGWDSSIELFKKWVLSRRIFAHSKSEKGKIYTMADFINHRLHFPEIYDNRNVYDDLMEACENLLRQYISIEFNDEDEEGE